MRVSYSIKLRLRLSLPLRLILKPILLLNDFFIVHPNNYLILEQG